MRRGEWWTPSFGGHLMLIAGRHMTLSVKELPEDVLQSHQDFIDAYKEDGNDDIPAWLYNKFKCSVSLGGSEIHLDKCGQTLEEAKQLCIDFAVCLCKQMLYELGEDIELTHVVVEV